MAKTTAAQLDEAYRVHFKAPYLLTQRLLPLMNDGGRVLNVSSGLARMTYPGYAAYAAMKAAVETFTRYLALALWISNPTTRAADAPSAPVGRHRA